MLILVIGGSGSGKSEYAERRCAELSPGKKLYIAAMEPHDEESVMRIARHRRMRDGRGFDTLECYTHLEQAAIAPYDTILLECLSNLLANEMFSPDGRRDADQATAAILSGVKRLTEWAGHVIVVTSQVFSDGVTYTPETELYRQCLARINREIAAVADEVAEVVHGIPVIIKRERPDITERRQLVQTPAVSRLRSRMKMEVL
ncbi:MAG: bifunctional adenosylcobinamide kinase/adenosylcobinamide-phosphate guanylyltransferase [Clostridiales bacterium]|nr:bifunctional adenosylcobinamide kinase/adenosylcobinamide-phosphate guanylyltransferase [Clostridiales bacterium]